MTPITAIPYTAVGRILIERGIIPKEEMSMQKIREWMAQNPDGAKELRRQNRAYIFFREVNLSDKDEAVGAQGIPLTAGRSIRGRQIAACLRHAVLHRGRAADRLRALQDAVPSA
jgi:membrane-bound lytic murein transglycosylase